MTVPNTPFAIDNRLTTALIVVDQEYKICQVNDAAETLLEQSHRQLLGCPLVRWIRQSEFSESSVLEALFNGKELYKQGSKLQLFSGRFCRVNVSITRFFEQAEAYLLIELNQQHPAVTVTSDENELGEHRRQRLMMRDLAHEIRNPLGGLRGAAQLLARQVSKKQQPFTDVILREADRLGLLVERVLGVGKAETKNYFNIHEILEDVINLVALDKPEAITITRDYDPSLPEFCGYHSSLYQAILNIIRNALEALESSGDRVSISTRAEHGILVGDKFSAMAIRIDISDNGPGVPQHLQENLFMPMKTGKIDGSGIGLSIATTAIEQQGGCLTWERQQLLTVFSIFLPFSRQNEVVNES